MEGYLSRLCKFLVIAHLLLFSQMGKHDTLFLVSGWFVIDLVRNRFSDVPGLKP